VLNYGGKGYATLEWRIEKGMLSRPTRGKCHLGGGLSETPVSSLR